MHHATTPGPTYSIDALIAEGFSQRTIRYYTNIGILPKANGRGPTAYYGQEHLEILRKIRQSRDEQRTLSEIREEARSRYQWAFRRS